MWHYWPECMCKTLIVGRLISETFRNETFQMSSWKNGQSNRLQLILINDLESAFKYVIRASKLSFMD